MNFRPCIDIHNGKVKQIVGGSLTDMNNTASENFVSEHDAAYYAALYKSSNLRGGHIILLNPPTSKYYEETRQQAFQALKAFPGGFQVGGGITAENACEYLEAGASHVIVTSYVFNGGSIQYSNLLKLIGEVGQNHLVLDLSCRKRDGEYVIMTDRWQKYTDVVLNHHTLDELASYCSEFLVHAVDVEGKAEGVEEELLSLLGSWNKIPITYAGGVHSYDDIRKIKELGNNKIHVTIGSALDLFGGNLEFDQVMKTIRE
ncbi:MAG: phosphoribosylformimino-5-aminoimidazole carboxamide ribotide isomerase [Lachnospiraceae bacterium]|nr:phosphoribosylformimino-5-aminoimidazole carboxamide ribotide isomerase [Lachnospiraceae bacterium]MDD3661120.1 phosphoribosylformimino-5-aminoimidazole carboxamide ribotide isomerase [Lachnospiraceae bacterium]